MRGWQERWSRRGVWWGKYIAGLPDSTIRIRRWEVNSFTKKYTLMGNNYNTMSRRALLRRGAMLAGGLPFAGSLINQLHAAPSVNGHAFASFASEGWTEREIALNAVEPLKARLYA